MSTYTISIDVYVSVEWKGVPTVETVRSLLRDIVTHQGFRQEMAVVVHCGPITCKVAMDEIAAMVVELASMRKHLGPVALIVGGGMHIRTGNVLNAYQDCGVRIEVFGSPTDALTWVDGELRVRSLLREIENGNSN